MATPEGGRSAPLRWTNGLIFLTQPLPPTEDVIKEQIQGTIHWSSLHFARMRGYQKEVKRGRSVTVPVIDLSNHDIFGAMADWIKEKYKQK